MEELFLPVLSHFQNQNGWTGSDGQLRYRITPSEEGLISEVWQGPWCYAFSRVEERQVFPLEETGLTALAEWIKSWHSNMNQRPKPTMAETLRLRDEATNRGAVED